MRSIILVAACIIAGPAFAEGPVVTTTPIHALPPEWNPRSEEWNPRSEDTPPSEWNPRSEDPAQILPGYGIQTPPDDHYSPLIRCILTSICP